MRHIMLDIETLGMTPGDVILSIGAVEFGDSSNSYFTGIDLASSLLAGFTINPVTLEWWTQQSEEAKGRAFNAANKQDVRSALEEFAKFVTKDTRVWAKGPDFDCVMLAAAYQKLGLKQPWSYRHTRDVRTITALAGLTVFAKPIVPHDPIADAGAQASDVIAAHQALGRMLE